LLTSYLLTLREGLEVALIIGIVIGVLRKIDRQDLSQIIWLALAIGIGFSAAAALGLKLLGAQFTGKAEEVFEGLTMLTAAIILTWMIVWMSKQAHLVKKNLETGIIQAINISGKWALFLLIFTAISREGLELALFIAATSVVSSLYQVILGVVLAIGTIVVVSWFLFKSLVKLPIQRFFQISGILLIIFSAGLIAQSVHEFNEAGYIPTVIEHVWNTSAFISADSSIGHALTALFGYNPTPSLTEVIAYWFYFLLVLLGLRWYSSKQVLSSEKSIKSANSGTSSDLVNT
jgi:high-affinity iron transporter